MNLYLSSANVKILRANDIVAIDNPKCLINESFTFQIYIEDVKTGKYPIEVKSDLPIEIYQVIFKKGNYERNKKTDDFYIHTENDMYPDLLLPTKEIDCNFKENKTLFFVISEQEKSVGAHNVEINIGDKSVSFTLNVVNARLATNDLIITHWLHVDGICNYYNVKPFSDEFYVHLKNFLAAYVRMGNTMLLVPMFTPPLDTEVGGERLTTQLVKVIKCGNEYKFDFSNMKKYIEIAKEYGIEYFELSHLFTQWGGEFCPKIIAEENGEEKRIFGWDTSSTDEKYLKFLQCYFIALNEFLIDEKIKENTYMHLTDEPNEKHIEKYVQLSTFVKTYNYGIKTIDALSYYELVEKTKLDLPAVCTQSGDMQLFANAKKLLYYCVWIDKNCLSNRYFHMPSIRTVILGMQLYQQNVQGFLHWGYNFYNTALSKNVIDPYEDATSGGEFVAGDAFIVYPSTNGVNYSLRYFSILKAFEDYRLLKTLENKIGRERVLELLIEYGIVDLHTYPHDVKCYEAMRTACYALLED